MDVKKSEEPRPWQQPPWKPAPGKYAVFLYLLLIHSLAAIGVILFPLPGLKVLAIALAFTALGGFGTTICYHRMLAHRTLRLNRVLEHLLIFCAMFNGSGTPASWVAYHRLHHARTDTPADVSSPKQGGFWWAHLRWLYQSAPADNKNWCPELTRRAYRIWSSIEIPVILLSLFCGFALGWPGFFWLGAIRLVYSLHMQCFVNSLTHLGRAPEGDSSRNIWWLGPLQLAAWGENWHRNHHANVESARFGMRWWQTDIGWYVICGLEAVGLAIKVKRPGTRCSRASSSTSEFRVGRAGWHVEQAQTKGLNR